MYITKMEEKMLKVECIDKGREAGATDVVAMENGIKQGWIQLVNLDKEEMREARRLMDEVRIGMGEAETLVLARSRNALAVLDDKEARAIAKI